MQTTNHSPTFLRSFIQLSTVNILSNLMVPLAGLMDVAFLGHLSDIHYLAGVALATVLINYIYWSFSFLRMGTTGTTAQAVGRDDRDAVLLIGLRHGILALAFGVAILALQQPLRSLGFSLLNAAPDVKTAGEAYYNALIWGAPATLTNLVVVGWLLGQARSRKVLLLSVVANGSKILLDYLFIVQFGWESAGAGLATAISQYLMLSCGILLVCGEVKLTQVKLLSSQLLDVTALKTTLLLNGEILIRTFALTTSFAVFTNLSAAMGTTFLATNAVLLQVVSLNAYFVDGLAYATESLAGMLHGKGDTHKLSQLMRFAGIASLSLSLGFAIAFNLAPTVLFRLLTSHSDIIANLQTYVFWLLPVLGFAAIAYMLDGYFLGLTQGTILRKSALKSTLLGFLPMAIAAWYFRNSHLLWLAMSLFMATRAITLSLQVRATFQPPPPVLLTSMGEQQHETAQPQSQLANSLSV